MQPTLEIQWHTPYAIIPSWIFQSGGKLSGKAIQLYGAIKARISDNGYSPFPDLETLAADVGTHHEAIEAHLNELIRYGALQTRTEGTSTYWTIVSQQPDQEMTV